VILGDPGAGKTTLLEYLAYKNAVFYKRMCCVPLFVKLSSQQEGFKHGLEDFIRFIENHYWKYVKLLKSVVTKGKFLVLMDGLDQIKSDYWDGVRTFAQSLVDSGHVVVLTCRKAAYTGGFIPSFNEYEIAGLSKQQQNQFIATFFKDNPNQGAKLIEELDKDEQTRKIMETPLLLSSTVLLYKKGEIKPPIRRPYLYFSIVKILEDWSTNRKAEIVEPLYRKRRMEFLISIAFDLSNAGKWVFSERDIKNTSRETLTEGEISQLLKELSIHRGLLAKNEDGTYSFLHQTFQEFLAALRVALGLNILASEYIQSWGGVSTYN